MALLQVQAEPVTEYIDQFDIQCGTCWRHCGVEGGITANFSSVELEFVIDKIFKRATLLQSAVITAFRFEVDHVSLARLTCGYPLPTSGYFSRLG